MHVARGGQLLWIQCLVKFAVEICRKTIAVVSFMQSY